MLFITADGRIGLLQLAVVLLLLKIHLTLGRYVACCKNIVNQAVAVVNDRHDTQFDVLVDALFREFHVLANMERLSAVQPKVILQQRIVSYQALTEELLAYHVETTQLAHLLIDIDKPPAGIVERHGHQAGIENLLVVRAYLTVALLVLHLMGDILDGVDDISGLTSVVLHNGLSIEISPLRGLFRASHPPTLHRPLRTEASLHLVYLFLKAFTLFLRQAVHKLVHGHSLRW